MRQTELACTHLYSNVPSNSPVSSKVCYFSTFCTFWALLGTPSGATAVNVIRMDEKRMSNASHHVSINFQPFMSYSEIIMVENCNFFLPLTLSASSPLGCTHWNSGKKKSGSPKTRIMVGLSDSEDSLTIVEPFRHNIRV